MLANKPIGSRVSMLDGWKLHSYTIIPSHPKYSHPYKVECCYDGSYFFKRDLHFELLRVLHLYFDFKPEMTIFMIYKC